MLNVLFNNALFTFGFTKIVFNNYEGLNELEKMVKLCRIT